MDWESTLQINKSLLYGTKNNNRKLGYNESTTQASTPAVSRSGHRTPKRLGSYRRSLNTPLDRLNVDDYFQDIAHALNSIKTSDFKLKDHEESTVSSGTPTVKSGGSDNTDSPKPEKQTPPSASKPRLPCRARCCP